MPRRAWIDQLLQGWGEADLVAFASLLGWFSTTLEGDPRATPAPSDMELTGTLAARRK
jgi:hypothetical protein